MAALGLVASGCGEEVPPREATIVNTMVEADYPLLISRPKLVVGKYARMAGNAYSFFRGTFALYLRDAQDSSTPLAGTDFRVDGALPLSIGDAHPENFGLLVAPDDTFAIEANDFDGADRYPYLWEVRRLGTGLVIAARLSNRGDDAARAAAVAAERDIARAVGEGYASTIVALANEAEPLRITDGMGNPIADDLFDRGTGDWADKEELDELSVVDDAGVRRLRRGGVDTDDLDNVYLDLPPAVIAALPETVEAYRQTLIAPPPAEYFTILDAARELGSGVASYPRVRIILLVRGPSDAIEDDVILELKELIDSGAQGWIPPGVSFDSVPDRILGASRSLWFRPDAEPLWGVSELYGLPVQLKHESEGLKTFRTNRFEDGEGTPEAMIGLGALLGGLLARMHAASGADVRDAIAGKIVGQEGAFADEQADVSVAYADQVLVDWDHFKNALDRLGPLFGLPLTPSPEDQPAPEMQALYGQPPGLPPRP